MLLQALPQRKCINRHFKLFKILSPLNIDTKVYTSMLAIQFSLLSSSYMNWIENESNISFDNHDQHVSIVSQHICHWLKIIVLKVAQDSVERTCINYNIKCRFQELFKKNSLSKADICFTKMKIITKNQTRLVSD